jgi:hypothetical protein
VVLQGQGKCSTSFLAKFFLLGKTNALRGKILSFQQTGMESIPEAWQRLQEYILACPHHRMDEWLVLQSFYNVLTPTSRAHINAIAGGAFLDLIIAKATTLVKKMVSNQGWSEECLQPRSKGMHTVKEANMLSAKMDLLLRKLDERVEIKKQMYYSVQAVDSHSMCEVCRKDGHQGMTALKPVKTLTSSSSTITTHSIHKKARGGTNGTHLIKEVIITTPISIRTSI